VHGWAGKRISREAYQLCEFPGIIASKLNVARKNGQKSGKLSASIPLREGIRAALVVSSLATKHLSLRHMVPKQKSLVRTSTCISSGEMADCLLCPPSPPDALRLLWAFAWDLSGRVRRVSHDQVPALVVVVVVVVVVAAVVSKKECAWVLREGGVCVWGGGRGGDGN
jgi:hypothetical protein